MASFSKFHEISPARFLYQRLDEFTGPLKNSYLMNSWFKTIKKKLIAHTHHECKRLHIKLKNKITRNHLIFFSKRKVQATCYEVSFSLMK